VVLSFDGKGVVMRPDGLRASTAKAAAGQKLTGRLSKGEKRNRKRMAEVAAVYDLTPVPRTMHDILPDGEQQHRAARPAPAAADAVLRRHHVTGGPGWLIDILGLTLHRLQNEHTASAGESSTRNDR
jgi:hypothetical protein